MEITFSLKVKSTLLIMQNINVTVTLLKIRILTSLWHFSRVGTLFRLLISLWHFFKRMYITQNINVAVILLRVRIYTENLSAWGSVKNLCKSSGTGIFLLFVLIRHLCIFARTINMAKMIRTHYRKDFLCFSSDGWGFKLLF